MIFWQKISILALSVLIGLGAQVAHATETPVLVPANEQEISSFTDALSSMTQDKYFKSIDASVHVIRVRDGHEMFSHNAGEARIPASTMKAITAASALRALGPSYRFSTELYVDGPVNGAGELNGNLYVKGLGDPSMVVEKLWKLVQELKLEGISTIKGDVVFDDSFFDTQRQIPGWSKKEDIERGPAYFATLSALSLNFNTVALIIGPAAEVGGAGRVVLETSAQGYVEVVNRTVTGAVGSRAWLEIGREVTPKGMKFTIEGVLPDGSKPYRVYRTVADPTAHFIAAWQGMEKNHGVRVRGKHKRGTVPVDATLFHRKQSPPLASILMDMNKYSNNFMAEQVLKTVGAEKYGAPGSVAKGLKWVSTYLVSLGLSQDDFTLMNGSGLSRDGFIKPTVLTSVLRDMALDRTVGGEFRASLAIAGLDGTLWRRLRTESGKMRGKTGTINGVHCLSGYFQADDGTEYAYSFLMNGLRGRISRAKKLQDQMLKTMMRSKVSIAKNGDSNTDSKK